MLSKQEQAEIRRMVKVHQQAINKLTPLLEPVKRRKRRQVQQAITKPVRKAAKQAGSALERLKKRSQGQLEGAEE